MDNHCLRRPAFGQIAAIGALYDARNECFISGSLFDKALPLRSVTESVIGKITSKVIQNDSYEDKFKLMGVGNDLGASIVAGLVVPDGAGRAFDAKTNSKHSLGAVLYHQILTVREKFDPTSPGVSKCRSSSVAENYAATHIMIEIEWGAQSVVMTRDRSGASKSRFQTQIQALQKAVETKYPISQGNAAWLRDNDMEIDVVAFSDILDDEIRMNDFQKFQEAYEFLSIIPAYIKHENNGKGKQGMYCQSSSPYINSRTVLLLFLPEWQRLVLTMLKVFYTLLPIPLLNVFLRTETTETITCIQPSEEFMSYFVKLFDEFDEFGRILNDYEALVLAHSWCVPVTQIQGITAQKEKLENARKDLKLSYARTLLMVRKGDCKLERLRVLLEEFVQGPSSPKEIARLDEYLQVKLQFIDKMVEHGATYIGYNGLDLNSELSKHDDGEVYVLFFSNEARGNQQAWVSNQALLLELLQKTRDKCFIAICDIDAMGSKLEKVHIRHFENGKELAADLVEEQHFLADKCFARYTQAGLEKDNILKPVRRRFVKIACPGHNCDKGLVYEWLCPQCMAPVEFGYSDQFFYCDCGRNNFKNYDFKCKGSNHGSAYAKYDANVLNGLLQSLDQSNYQNILILGETGYVASIPILLCQFPQKHI